MLAVEMSDESSGILQLLLEEYDIIFHSSGCFAFGIKFSKYNF